MKATATKVRTLLEIINEKDIKELITVDSKSPVMEALTIMAKFKIGALIVLHKDKMVGIISERDYAREMILEGRSSKDTKVKEIMTKKVLTLSAEDNFEKGLEIMNKKRIRHMPVMDGKKLIGMVSQGDLVKEMIDYQKELIKELKAFVYW
ncbi:MAG: CBS domain-containing protein [Nitrosomonadales bacterium]|jgi:CBS domain-containing protein|nr:CBS domain-containing protein [Nitrosomonadales bacterium]MBT3918292.1 CBS domain-containing protein [Nitrosomonadales bacterium]MBT4183594.1 CBS domain-containing protein [Nitrosomonadales bacterium]MBT4570869.1 CBS domain-containing protein [Nitrosomonadales bacterium]MBT4759953.1 CBS domain-containing protein [Nitrosomonadales bacterium]